MNFGTNRLLVAIGVLLLSSVPVHGGHITIPPLLGPGETPPGLNPGDMYHLVFLTVETTETTSADIDYYNAFVQNDAETPGYVTANFNWRAIASTPTVDARDNALVEGPVFGLDGTLIATGFNDFWDGSLLAPIELDPRPGVNSWVVWTGTSPSGFKDLPLGDPSGMSRAGRSSESTSAWISQFPPSDTFSNFFNWKLYALSEKLTVPVPEPTSFAVLTSLGIMGLCFSHRRSFR